MRHLPKYGTNHSRVRKRATQRERDQSTTARGNSAVLLQPRLKTTQVISTIIWQAKRCNVRFLSKYVQFWQNICDHLRNVFDLHAICDVLFEI